MLAYARKEIQAWQRFFGSYDPKFSFKGEDSNLHVSHRRLRRRRWMEQLSCIPYWKSIANMPGGIDRKGSRPDCTLARHRHHCNVLALLSDCDGIEQSTTHGGVMCNCRAASRNTATELLKALNWVHRTGWLTREMDTITAMRNFDACKVRRGPFTEFEDLVGSLWAVFDDQYDDEVAGHLVVIFLVSLEDRLCYGDDEERRSLEPCSEGFRL